MSFIPEKFKDCSAMHQKKHHQGNKTKQKIQNCIVYIVIVICMILGAGVILRVYHTKVNKRVQAYEDDIRYYAQLYGIEDYVPLIEAVMMQESRGKGTDVMQSSECMYNLRYAQQPNSIKDVQYSIDVGVHYLQYCLSVAGVQGPDDMDAIRLALQGYNYGSGYIEWAIERDGKYTKENAILFSQLMKDSEKIEVYGDTDYVSHVLRFYHVR